MNARTFDPRTADRDSAFIDDLRRKAAAEVFFKNQDQSLRSVAVDAFIDAMFDRLIEARQAGDEQPFLMWVDQAVRGAHRSLGFDAIADACTIVEVMLAQESGRFDWICEKLRETAGDAMLRNSMQSVEDHGAIDEVDARINDLVMRLEEADMLTAEHSRAVASWCARIGRRLRLGDDETALLRRSGLLHDVGKLKVPKEVLNAPRTLTEREWKYIRAHTAAGESIAKKDPILRETLPAIRSHHERYTGGGYPDDLRGHQIPFIARVVTVADAFNAMIGRRPYRPPLLPSTALEELRKHRETQFDPEIVDAMTDVVLNRDLG